ncbi:MAG: hypothetical protein JNM38_22730 [Acidobacteria bacterium]|nr:hypothetical protein [Acidobacteriota bacterium]
METADRAVVIMKETGTEIDLLRSAYAWAVIANQLAHGRSVKQAVEAAEMAYPNQPFRVISKNGGQGVRLTRNR